MASTTSTDRQPSRRFAFGILAAGIVLPLALSACSSGAEGSTAKDSARGQQSAPSRGAAAGSPETADRKVLLEGSLDSSYAAPNFAAFVRKPHVVNVISGTVTATRPLVTPPANTVETILTISVERQRDKSAPTTVEVREQGGVVTVAQVRSDFESKLGRKLTSAELAETVDFSFNGAAHARVGDRVLVVVADDDAVQKEGAYVSLARLAKEDVAGGLSKVNSTKFTWLGEIPNPAWERTVDVEPLMQ
ncbi:hypothetical protein [Streptomyces lateritius]|uniref:hypothetical protein n=1 Tax=Streptomyces lateritius TaxID=67313 RepID=UPI001C8C0DF2|nr:hypothetical protein [Streptomyces lateritius]MBX9422917.1 hypothetical protein [Streptomyces lateritius]